jgi:hypothetical protein
MPLPEDDTGYCGTDAHARMRRRPAQRRVPVNWKSGRPSRALPTPTDYATLAISSLPHPTPQPASTHPSPTSRSVHQRSARWQRQPRE